MFWSNKRGGKDKHMYLNADLFNIHCGATVQYRRHGPMQHIRGYTGRHWMPTSGDYSLHIAPAATRAIANKTSMKNVPSLLAVLKAVLVRWYSTEHIAQLRRFMAFLKATTHHHQVSIASIRHAYPCFLWCFSSSTCQNIELTFRPLLTLGVWHIKMMRSTYLKQLDF
jgi:hypothetical protein